MRKRFEYFDIMIVRDKKAKINMPKIEDMNYYGERGWQLVYCDERIDVPQNEVYYYCIFMRQKTKTK